MRTGKLKDSRYKFPPETHKISGKVYHYLIWSRLKEEAERDAARWRKVHPEWQVRVMRSLSGWAIYYRR